MIDSHCHINDEAFVNNPEEYIKEANIAGVSDFLIVGYNLKSSRIAADFAAKLEHSYAAVGIHPSDVKEMQDDDLEEIEKLLQEPNVVCVGEIGLDFYWDKDRVVQDKQKDIFIKQIELANKYNKPISVHCRDAIEECYKILKRNRVLCGGVMHCFSGSKEMAQKFIKIGFKIGVGGTLTFKNSVKPKEVIQAITSNDYVLETDAPYLTPHPFRGQQNHSKYLYLVRDAISFLRGESIEQVDTDSTNNFRNLFKI